MEDNNFTAAGQDFAPIPGNNEPYTVNNIPVTDYQPQYEQSAQYGGTLADAGKNKATASMVLGIVSVVLGIVSLFFGFVAVFALACGIIAIVLSRQSRLAALLSGVQRRAEEKAGFVTGIIGTVSGAVIFVIKLLIKLLISGAVMLLFGYITQTYQGY